MKSEGIFQFGEFQIDALARSLRREAEIVTLNRRAFDVLLYLVQNPGKVLTRDELLKNVWPESFVDENSLAQSISALRRALEEKPGDNSYIVTLPGRGYQFVAPVKVVDSGNGSRLPEVATSASNVSAALLLQQQTIRTSVITEENEPLSLPSLRNRVVVTLGAVSAVAAIAVAGYLRMGAVPQAAVPRAFNCNELDRGTGCAAPFHRGSRFSQPFRPSRRRLDIHGARGNVEHRTGGRRKAAPGFRRRHRAHQTRSSSRGR